MARPLGLCGFECGNNAHDGIINISSSIVYSTTDLPPGSLSGRRAIANPQGEAVVPWIATGSTATETPVQPIGSPFRIIFGMRAKPGVLLTNPAAGWGLTGPSGEVIRLLVRTNDTRLFLYVGGVEVAASATTVGIDWRRYTVDWLNGPDGYIKVYIDGDISNPVIDYHLLLQLPPPNAFSIKTLMSNNNLTIDDMFAVEVENTDPSNILRRYVDVSVQRTLPIANATYTDWTGDYTDIDEVPYSDNDMILANDVDLTSTFKMSPILEDQMLFGIIKARTTASGSDAGQNIQVHTEMLSSVTLLPSTPTAVPGDGFFHMMLEKAPDGSDWTPERWTDSEIGFVTRT